MLNLKIFALLIIEVEFKRSAAGADPGSFLGGVHLSLAVLQHQ